MNFEHFCELEDGQIRHGKKQLTLRLAISVLAHIELIATQEGCDRNRVIRLAIYEFLKSRGVENPHQI